MTVSVNTRLAEQYCETVLRQFPFAVANTLNRIAFDFRDAERRDIEGRFIIRRPWVVQGVQVPAGQLARKDRLQVRVEVERKRDFLAKFEPGGVKRARGGGSIAIPDDQTFRRSQVVPKAKRPKAFQFAVHRTKSGKVQFKGKDRTFIVELSTFEALVFQRTGRGRRSDLRLLYRFTRGVNIAPDLRFRARADQVFKASYGRIFQEELVKALKTARVR